MKIKVWKEREKKWIWTYNMWCGSCTCGITWQYWDWGATMGYGLSHMWRKACIV